MTDSSLSPSTNANGTRVRTMHLVAATVATIAIALGAAACGSADSGAPADPAEAGRQVAIANNCTSCHGAQGQGGIGPSWQGLAGSEVRLEDGTTVIADDDYLLRSILDPSAEIVAGATVLMAYNGISEADAREIVTYIKSLPAPDA